MQRLWYIWRWVLCLMLSGWTGSALAAEPQLLPPDLTLKSWTKEDGLPANSVTAVLLTHDGYVWVGTPNGLARFDGLRFVQVKPSGMNPDDGLRVTTLCEDSSGRLWVGTQGSGLYCFANGSIKKFSRTRELQDLTITSIAEDRNHNLWIGTPSGLNRFEGTKIVRVTSSDGLPNNFFLLVNAMGMLKITVVPFPGRLCMTHCPPTPDNLPLRLSSPLP